MGLEISGTPLLQDNQLVKIQTTTPQKTQVVKTQFTLVFNVMAVAEVSRNLQTLILSTFDVQGVSGIRYKCSSCPDYDLCEACEKKGGIHDGSHVFLKITKPIQALGRGCPYGRPWAPRMNHRNFRGCGGSSPQQTVRYLARFVSDVSILDGTMFSAEQQFVKIWRMRNEGTTNWPELTRLVFVGGDNLSNVESVQVASIGPGSLINERRIGIETQVFFRRRN